MILLNNKKWTTGHIDPWWDDSFKTLDYKYRPLPNIHDEVRWIDEGYKNVVLNGAIYDMKNEMSDWTKPFFKLFGWENIGISFYRMNTLNMLPVHIDLYPKYRQLFNIQDLNIVNRAIVFLDNWKSGHYFEIDNVPFVNWRRGDFVTWNNDVPHFAGNFGLEPRYTLQITGMKND